MDWVTVFARLYMAGVSERIFSNHDTLGHFQPNATVRQKLFPPEDKTSKQKGVIVYVVQYSEEITNLHIGKVKELQKLMAQHKLIRSRFSGARVTNG